MILSKGSDAHFPGTGGAARPPAPSEEALYLALMERLFPSRPKITVETALKGYDPLNW